MPFTEDLSQFFDTADFADAAVITTGPGPTTKTINVIFNDPTEGVSMYESTIEAPAPFLTCKASDLADVAKGQSVAVNGDTFTIARIRKDGTGTATIDLKT